MNGGSCNRKLWCQWTYKYIYNMVYSSPKTVDFHFERRIKKKPFWTQLTNQHPGTLSWPLELCLFSGLVLGGVLPSTSRGDWGSRHVYIVWVVVSNSFYFHPYLGKIPILTNIFQIDVSNSTLKNVYIEPISISTVVLTEVSTNYFLDKLLRFGSDTHGKGAKREGCKSRKLLISALLAMGCVPELCVNGSGSLVARGPNKLPECLVLCH